MGGPIILSKPALAVFRKINRFEAPVIKASGGVEAEPNLPRVVLTSVGARSGDIERLIVADASELDERGHLLVANDGPSLPPLAYELAPGG